MLFSGHQGDGMAAVARPAGAADAVDVVLGLVRQIEIHHMGQLMNVNAAGGDVGGDQHPQLAALEPRQGTGAGPLALVAMDRRRRHALGTEPVGDAIRTMLGAGEDQHLLPVIAGDQMAEQIRLARHIARVKDVLNRCRRAVFGGDLKLDGLMEQTRRQATNRGLEGGREQQVLALRRQQPQDFLDVADEAHVEHPIRFIQHQDLDAIQADRPLLHQVHQAARRGHQHIGASLQPGDLGIDLDPAKDHIAAQVQVP